MSKKVNQLTLDIENSKRELEELTKQFDTFETKINEIKLPDLKNSADTLKEKFNKILSNFKQKILGNIDYVFDYDDEAEKIGKFFGSFKIKIDFKQVSFSRFLFQKLNNQRN